MPQVCSCGHHVPDWKQDCGNEGHCHAGDQPWEIYLYIYVGPFYSWRNCSAACLLCFHTKKPIQVPPGPPHTICDSICHLLQVSGFREPLMALSYVDMKPGEPNGRCTAGLLKPTQSFQRMKYVKILVKIQNHVFHITCCVISPHSSQGNGFLGLPK